MSLFLFGLLWFLLAVSALFAGILHPIGVLVGALCGALWAFIFLRERWIASIVLVCVLFLVGYTLAYEPKIPHDTILYRAGIAMGFILGAWAVGFVNSWRSRRLDSH